MTRDATVCLSTVPHKTSIDQATRQRVAGHLRARLAEIQKDNPAFNQKDLAKVLKVSPGAVSRLLNETGRSLGLDLVLAINRHLRINADFLLNQDPPTKAPKR